MTSVSFVQDIQPLSAFRSNDTGFIKQVQTTLLQDIYTAERQILGGCGVTHEDALAQSLVTTTELGTPE
jgi:hypothetical protein